MRYAALLAGVMMGSGLGSAARAETPIGGGDRIEGQPFATRAPVYARHGMAATAQPLATQVAIDLLKAGGSAVDAAIGANAVLGLMEPVACGVGGDLFALVWDPKTKALHGLNGSGRSPAGLSYEAMKAKLGDRAQIPPRGPLPVSVPGAVDGWFTLHARFGRLPMAKVLAPAIRYAEEGFPVSPLVAEYWRLNLAAFERSKQAGELADYDNARATYLVAGQPPKAGEIFKNPDLARTYRALARGGAKAFYRGKVAATIEAYMKRVGGALTARDLAAHKSEWVTPMHVTYRGYEVYELPPNGQGLAALQMLAILEGFDLRKMGLGSAAAIHAMVEAKRLAFEDRARFYADPAFYSMDPMRLLAPARVEAQRARILPDHAMASAALPAPEEGDTTYLTVADERGMMISLIQSNYRGMGSGLVPDGLGFMLQDRGELFTMTPGHANVYAPGKRPFHTIIPAFVLKDGAPWLSFGVMGGAMQPQGHVQILTNLIDFDLGLQEAGDAARWRHEGSSEPTGQPADGVGTLLLESGIRAAARAGLEQRGHRLAPGDGGFGGYQAIRRDPATGVYEGASEMRKDGCAMGY
ncbi:MAG: gamma-glutamyltransferase family protein [Deltaproteobacteria bacterium]|nr:gamma-glutamyltransferase family protein [Deltaproteobacteria bacterium]